MRSLPTRFTPRLALERFGPLLRNCSFDSGTWVFSAMPLSGCWRPAIPAASCTPCCIASTPRSSTCWPSPWFWQVM
ncbi:unnamed protein product [Symbiodinium sp. CCMP2456]|nr:unnamed protein product [Symbiodinium sp. CCMP2456]